MTDEKGNRVVLTETNGLDVTRDVGSGTETEEGGGRGTELCGGAWKAAAGGKGLQGAFPVLVLKSLLEKHVV